jgi:hypothetical protein
MCHGVCTSSNIDCVDIDAAFDVLLYGLAHKSVAVHACDIDDMLASIRVGSVYPRHVYNRWESRRTHVIIWSCTRTKARACQRRWVAATSTQRSRNRNELCKMSGPRGLPGRWCCRVDLANGDYCRDLAHASDTSGTFKLPEDKTAIGRTVRSCNLVDQVTQVLSYPRYLPVVDGVEPRVAT